MSHVFLSYAREDRARAEQIAAALERGGLQIFWDNEIPPGQTWADYIEQKLTQCSALIVLWSEHSTKSQWVREEARMGRDKGVLIPVLIDKSQAPFGFGEVQAADLSTWSGDENDATWRRFAAAVANGANSAPRPAQVMPAAPPRAAERPPGPTPQHMSAPTGEKKSGVPLWVWITGGVVGAFALLIVIGLALGGGRTDFASTVPGPGATTPPQVNYQQQILNRLAGVEQAFAAQGFQQISEPVSGQLPLGQSLSQPLSLEAGGDYRIIGVCDNDCGNLDLILYDENNNLISQDQMTDATPVVAVAPQWTGAFTVNVVMSNCTVNPCYYALVLYGRPLSYQATTP